ncbi:MAG: methyltransferase domain-containing protein [Treponema sp.]|jgi:SAM-dependent methyltransferase|nr:methyltransferase domain-containing protein [Treponema sp.]
MENIHKDTVSIKSYDEMATYYENYVDTKPWNAYYERPAVLSLLPEIKNKKILDVGCAGGWYTKYLLDHGADVTAIDVNKNMVEITKKRVQDKCPVIQTDLNNKLDFIKDDSLDIVLASLVLHYLKDVTNAFAEFNRILKPEGEIIFSIHHPLMEILHFKRENYMAIELLEDEWTMGEEKIKVQFYRKPINKILQPLIDNGFYIENVLEAEPTNEFKEKLPEAYERLLKRPNFLFIKAKKMK